MKILILTTLPNRVVAALDSLPEVDLHIIDVLTVEDLEDAIRRVIQSNSPDLLFTYRCPHIISTEFIEAIPLGAYNIHPSLLPEYKGLNPWQRIFENKETKSGVTLHRITEDVDSGEIILQESFSINSDDTINSARSTADMLAARMVKTFVRNRGGHLSPIT